MAKTVTLRLDEETYASFVERAKAERRSLSNFIEMAAVQYTKETEFVEIEEMNDLMNDQGLVKRLRQGMKDAKQKKGRFVEE